MDRLRLARGLRQDARVPRAQGKGGPQAPVQVEGNLAFRKPVAADPPPSPKYAKGDTAALTNGVRGAADFKVHWLGWEGVDVTLTLDLGKAQAVGEISFSTLSDFRSWILHPNSVACAV